MLTRDGMIAHIMSWIYYNSLGKLKRVEIMKGYFRINYISLIKRKKNFCAVHNSDKSFWHAVAKCLCVALCNWIFYLMHGDSFNLMNHHSDFIEWLIFRKIAIHIILRIEPGSVID